MQKGWKYVLDNFPEVSAMRSEPVGLILTQPSGRPRPRCCRRRQLRRLRDQVSLFVSQRRDIASLMIVQLDPGSP